MKGVALRRTILLCAIGLLACVLVVQVIGSRKTIARTLTAAQPDALTVQGAALGSVSLARDGEDWSLVPSGYEADGYTAGRLANAVTDLTLLMPVEKNAGDIQRAQYGLGDDEGIVVVALDGDAVLRRLVVGKQDSGAAHTYVMVDEDKTVYLADGALRDLFLVTEQSVRSRSVYSLTDTDIVRIAVTSGDGRFAIERDAPSVVQGDDTLAAVRTAWRVAFAEGSQAMPGADVSLDDEAVSSWLIQLASLECSQWEESTPLGEARQTVRLDAADGRSVTVALYGQAGDADVTCTSTAAPTPFVIPSYRAARYEKTLAELKNGAEE